MIKLEDCNVRYTGGEAIVTYGCFEWRTGFIPSLDSEEDLEREFNEAFKERALELNTFYGDDEELEGRELKDEDATNFDEIEL